MRKRNLVKVKLIALTQSVEGDTQSPEQLIEYAGRKCTATCEKTGSNTANFVRTRVKQGHMSVLEHVNFTFEINGISRSCLAQLTRHRIGFSYSVQSMRYVMQSANFVIPDSIAQNQLASGIFEHLLIYCKKAYDKLIGCGIPKEDARFVMPIATETNLVLTANLRALLHFFELRLDKAAQWEIRELAGRIKEIVMEYCPSVFIA